MSLVSKWSLWSEQSSPGCSTVVIRAEQQADIHTNILNTLLGLKIRLQKCWSIVNGNCVTVTYSMMMDGNRLFYWSTPAALLVRFRGDVLGDALSVRQDVKSAVCVASFIYKQKITFHITEERRRRKKDSLCYYLWRLGIKWTYSWHWESPEGSSWCPHRLPRRCLSRFSLRVSFSAK